MAILYKTSTKREMNVFAISFAIIFSGIGANDEVEDSLILVHAIVRHGHRSPDPVMAFPTDVYRNYSYYPYGEGELNREGRVSSYKVGKKLKMRYNKFLGDTYYPSLLTAISSGSSRCRMTMQLLLAAMFPPNSAQTFSNGLAWQPIPIIYKDCKNDPMICFKRCLNLLLSIQLNENLALCKDRDYMNELLTNHSGTKIETILSLYFIQDTIKSELENNLELPKWAESIWPETLMTCAHDFWRSATSNATILAMTGGPFMKKIINDTKNKINENVLNPLKNKLIIYSAHDYNIYMLLGMLNLYNNIIVNYLDCLIFEVHKIKDVYGFKIFYDHQDGKGFQQLEIPNCGSFCPVDEFHKLLDTYFHSETC